MTLGLFPLNLVLFPGVRLPLHIFEPRYKALVNECLERGVPFGINLAEDGHLNPVGCFATVVEVVTRHADGRMDIIVEGTGRYTLLEIVTSDSPYAVGAVEEYHDASSEYDSELLSGVLESYNRVVTMVYGLSAPTYTNDEIQEMPSFAMAPKSGLSTAQKQMLLEMQDETMRLVLLKEHYRDVLPAVKRAEAIQRVVRNDGYLRRDG